MLSKHGLMNFISGAFSLGNGKSIPWSHNNWMPVKLIFGALLCSSLGIGVGLLTENPLEREKVDISTK